MSYDFLMKIQNGGNASGAINELINRNQSMTSRVRETTQVSRSATWI